MKDDHGPAAIIPFPLDRRRRKVATAARTLAERKTQEGRERYWARTVNGLASEMARHGCDQEEIDRQVSRFFRAVEIELSTIPVERAEEA
ncbi:DUF6074 family protein [Pelagibacterium sp.]